MYSVPSHTFLKLSDTVCRPQWLHDSRHLVGITLPDARKIVLLDRVSKSVHELLKVTEANEYMLPVAVSPDDRKIFLFRASEDGDIWIANLR